MTFEFDIEVRPEFEMPKWKGFKINRAVREFTDEDVDQHLEKMLTRFGQLVPHDGEAHGRRLPDRKHHVTSLEGKQLATKRKSGVLRIRPNIEFP